jgi:flagellar protein FliO/FliZ
LYLGGEKLKLPFFTIRRWCAVFIMGTGLLFVRIPSVSAQAVTPEDDPILAAEQALTLEDGSAGIVAAVPGPSIGTVVRMVLTLVLAAAAIYGVVFFIKRASRRTDIKDPFLKILASTHLGYNRYAHVVAVGSKAWLLGASEGGVNLISEIEDKDILNALLLEDSRKSAEAPAGRFLDFKAMLRRLGAPVESGAPDADNIRKRRERLKGL